MIARLAKRPNGICEMWLFLRVDGIGEFEVSGGHSVLKSYCYARNPSEN